MKGKSVKKVPGGKLIRVDVEYGEIIEQVKITGDFFLHPEDCLTAIEESLKGSRLPIDKPRLQGKIEGVLKVQQADLIGVSVEDIITTLEEAIACSSA
jgi:lipoate-protein ligase A